MSAAVSSAWTLVLLPTSDLIAPTVVDWLGLPPASVVLGDPEYPGPGTVYVRRMTMPGQCAVYTASARATVEQQRDPLPPEVRPLVHAAILEQVTAHRREVLRADAADRARRARAASDEAHGSWLEVEGERTRA